MIRFSNPYVPVLILGAFGVTAFIISGYARYQKKLKVFADARLLNTILAQVNPGVKKARFCLLIAAVWLAFIAFCSPQWGFYWEEVEKEGMDIIFAVDCSRSMLAEDIKPSRLENVKSAVKNLLGYLQGNRVGLIGFSGKAFLICPLTSDFYGFSLCLDDIDTSVIPVGGTSLSAPIEEALRASKFAETKDRILIIITDGEDNISLDEAMLAAKQAQASGLKIFCVGVGTSEGELIPVQDKGGGRDFLKDKEGNIVVSRLAEEALQSIAIASTGGYVRATSADFGLERLYRKKISQLDTKELRKFRRKKFYERYQFFLGAALFLLIIEAVISERKYQA